MNRLLYFHAAATVLVGAILRLFVSQSACVGFVFGALVSLANFAILTVVWPRILAKKQVALSVGIIVIKFAILALVLYEVATRNVVRVEWFTVGLGMIILTVLSASILLPSSLPLKNRVS